MMKRSTTTLKFTVYFWLLVDSTTAKQRSSKIHEELDNGPLRKNANTIIDHRHRFQLSCADNEHLFELKLTTDIYGFETSWSLEQRSNGKWTEILFGPKDVNAPYGKSESVKEMKCLPDGHKYRFTIKDRFSDGFCCDFGEGKYSFSLDGVEQYNSEEKGKTFTDSEKHVFELDQTADISPASTDVDRAPSNYRFGDLNIRNDQLGIDISSGLSARLLASTGKFVDFVEGSISNLAFHDALDAAQVVPLPDGGWAYVSNSERSSGRGGVYALYFDSDGNVVDYKALLTGLSRACGNGVTPWNTVVSCEEISGGQCYQMDPDPSGENHLKPVMTKLGGPDGGSWESVAVENSNPNRPVFFITEDNSQGVLKRFKANGNGWDSLQSDPIQVTYLRIMDGTTFEWTGSEEAGRESARRYFAGAEGISYRDGTLYFIAKVSQLLYSLDLDSMTYEVERTGFPAQPDQIALGKYGRYIYFCEDGGTPGVYARDVDGSYETVFSAIRGGCYDGDETVGIALSPDSKRLYAGYQDAGILMEFTRDDGLAFE
mmetsp:Transcript_20351/g.41910  ORF Transcript_20351/g.41910 Transcript_20351/m.41910 type:complete len:544 (-) Transcript_20351:142-1773(-)